jgi:hypothetical protein
MKTIKSLCPNRFIGIAVAALLLISYSCSTETSSVDLKGSLELNGVYAKGKKARPIEAKLHFMFDYENTAGVNIVPCPGAPAQSPGANPVALFQTIVSGNMSHLGNLQPGSEFDDAANVPLVGSYLVPESCDGTSFPTLETVYNAVYVAANGDELWATENVSITFMDARSGFFVGTSEVVGGTGRFEGASGAWELKNGIFDALPGGEGASWEIEGEITY